MSANDKYWEKVIKEKLEGYEKNPPKWDEFETRLNKHIKIKRLTKVGSFVLASIAIVALIYTISKKSEQKQLMSKLPNKIKVEHKILPHNDNSSSEKTFITKDNKTKKQKNEKSRRHDKSVIANKKVKTNNSEKTPFTSTTESSETESLDTLNNKHTNTAINHEKKNEFEFSVTNIKGCAPLNVKIELKGTNISECTFYVGDNKTQANNNKNITVTLDKAGKYKIIAVVTFTNGEIKTYKYDKTIEVLSTPKANFVFDKGKLIDMSLSSNKILWSIDNTYTFSNRKEINVDYLNPGTHQITLIAINKGCSDTLHKEIEIEEPIIEFMPNAFTPNGDGRNDVFKPTFNVLPDFYKMIIFDQFGKTIFVTTDPQIGWDGKGYEKGLYVWKLIYKDNNGNMIEKTGNVTLQKN